MKQKNKIIILIIISVVLIFSALRGVYYTYKTDKSYELRGWETTNARCIQENSYIKGTNNIQYYQREYIYIVSGQEYKLNTVEIYSKPCKTIKYNPINPKEAETFEGINKETIFIFVVGVIGIFSPFILKFINTKKINEIKSKVLRSSKTNVIKIVTVCFWGYLAISLISVLKEIFLTPNWSQIATQYSQLEIIIECSIYIIGRCGFEKSTSYFNIFWI